MSFADQLKQERKTNGLTQVEAATLLGIPARTYWEWESGKTTPAEITQEGAINRLKSIPK